MDPMRGGRRKGRGEAEHGWVGVGSGRGGGRLSATHALPSHTLAVLDTHLAAKGMQTSHLLTRTHTYTHKHTRNVRLSRVVSTARHSVNATKNLDRSQSSNLMNMTMMRARPPPQPTIDRSRYSNFLQSRKEMDGAGATHSSTVRGKTGRRGRKKGGGGWESRTARGETKRA
jgi:hypothetical protein